MTLIEFMEHLRSEGFTAEEMFAVMSTPLVSRQSIESASFAEITKFVKQLKNAVIERRKIDPYKESG